MLADKLKKAKKLAPKKAPLGPKTPDAKMLAAIERREKKTKGTGQKGGKR